MKVAGRRESPRRNFYVFSFGAMGKLIYNAWPACVVTRTYTTVLTLLFIHFGQPTIKLIDYLVFHVSFTERQTCGSAMLHTVASGYEGIP